MAEFSKLNRRSFFKSAATLAAAFSLDPERLLWTPGQKTIFVPPAVVSRPLSDIQKEFLIYEHNAEMFRIAMAYTFFGSAIARVRQ